MKRTISSEQGFSILEVLVASAILGVMVYSSIQIVKVGSLGSNGDQLYARAVQIATSQMEDLVSRSPTDPWLQPPPATHPTIYYDQFGNLLQNSTGAFYTVTWQVTANKAYPNASSPTPFVNAIQETVSWTIKGIPHSYILNNNILTQ